jgi:hypothetical protein
LMYAIFPADWLGPELWSWYFILSPTCTTVARLLSYDCFCSEIFLSPVCVDSYVTFSIPNTLTNTSFIFITNCVTVLYLNLHLVYIWSVFYFQFVYRSIIT